MSKSTLFIVDNIDKILTLRNSGLGERTMIHAHKETLLNNETNKFVIQFYIWQQIHVEEKFRAQKVSNYIKLYLWH